MNRKYTAGSEDGLSDVSTSSRSLEIGVDAVADRHRRSILNFLLEEPDTVIELEAVVDHVLARETDNEIESMAADRRQRLITAVHHTHLPKLAKTGVLDYDLRSHTVRYRGDLGVEELSASVEKEGK